MSKSARDAVGVALLLGTALAPWAPARAERVDPTLPLRRVIGAPAGAQPMFRGDGARSGRAREELPTEPRLLWRARLTGGLDLPPAVDDAGRLVAASPMSQLVQLDAKGKLAWSLKLGAAPPAQGPVITTDGTRVAVTAAAELFGVAPDGTLRWRRSLPVASVRDSAAPLPTRDGGLVMAVPGALLALDQSGGVKARAQQADPPVTLIEHRGRILVVTEKGDVLSWRPPEDPTRLGSFGGRVDGGAALSSDNHLTAVVDHERLMDFELSSRTRHTRLESTERLQGPPAVLPGGETRVASFAGLMLGHDRAGLETARAALEPGSGAGTPGVPGLVQPPPLVVDPRGRVAYVRPGLDAGVVLESGEQKAAAGAACGDPLSLAPAGRRRFVVACRSGLILMIGQ